MVQHYLSLHVTARTPDKIGGPYNLTHKGGRVINQDLEQKNPFISSIPSILFCGKGNTLKTVTQQLISHLYIVGAH